MWQDDDLNKHLKTSPTLKVASRIFAEWNMNQPENIARVGNYRYRPNDAQDTRYGLLPLNYDPFDVGNFYTGATDAYVDIVTNTITTDSPVIYQQPDKKRSMLYSLSDCVQLNRPRSGINKMIYLHLNGAASLRSQWFNYFRTDYSSSPRYYLASSDDYFKYWSSYRTENGKEYGVAQLDENSSSDPNIYITDANPFVVYKETVAANRIIVKMQTNVGIEQGSSVRIGDKFISDPFYGENNSTVPARWRVEVLKNNTWITAFNFDESTQNIQGQPLIGADGYVELQYGVIVPNGYQDFFRIVNQFSVPAITTAYLPEFPEVGDAVLFTLNTEQYDRGTFYMYGFDGTWISFPANYGWQINTEDVTNHTSFVTKFVDPEFFIDSSQKVFREFDAIQGIRVAVRTMNKANCTFDLIEMSPRLICDITDMTIDFQVSKILSDMGTTNLPVGGLNASTGEINIMDDADAFIENNPANFNVPTDQPITGSIVAKWLNTQIKFSFYEIIRQYKPFTMGGDSLIGYYDAYIPVKTMYSEGFPQASSEFYLINIKLRDLFYVFEQAPAPEIFLQNVSVSLAIAILLDYIGFTNYVFKRIPNTPDPVIPYFFVPKDANVAQILQDIALGTQSAMYFDEYNNFVVMMKEYAIPTATDRDVDNTLLGQIESETISYNDQLLNIRALPNIVNISSQDKKVYNAGVINYTTRYIQRTYGSFAQAPYVNSYKTWIYLPALLWEVSSTENLRAINDVSSQQDNYSLSACPLNTDLTSALPTVQFNRIINNILDLGEGVYWLTKHQGYLYANGEIIKYDAIEYYVGGVGNVWISNNEEYQNYFGALAFGQKMYPTGNVRIYAKPFYYVESGTEKLQNGAVQEHGRGQFGTEVTSHYAGLENYWTDATNRYGCRMQAKYLFDEPTEFDIPLTKAGAKAGVDKIWATRSNIGGVLKNYLTTTYYTETTSLSQDPTLAAVAQASALVYNGPADLEAVISIPEADNPTATLRDYISYVYKNFDSANNQMPPYKHFGTRMRIIGKIESQSNKTQTAVGSTTYLSVAPNTNDQQVELSGGSGGIGVMVNPENNNGYFFEIIALTSSNVSDYTNLNQKQIVTNGIETITRANNVVTAVTTTTHTFQVGDQVEIVGYPTGTFNGIFTITQSNGTARTFSYQQVGANGLSTDPGEARSYIGTGTIISNVIFYKMLGKNYDGVLDPNSSGIPVMLWRGLANIIVDDGLFAGSQRLSGEVNPTVYDLAVEYNDVGSSRTFYLYLNNKIIATVTDNDPLPISNNVSLFVRGSSKCIFENVYALGQNYALNTSFTVIDSVNPVFDRNEINAVEALRKYALSGFVQSSYLSGISTKEPPKYNIFFDEFGTIMREAAYFNIKYDRAWPAIYAKLAPTINTVKTYSTSGFYAGPYGAEFLLFNCMDKNITLDATTGNYLRILGVTFTQNTTHELTVDNYFDRVANLANPIIGANNNLLYSPLQKQQEFTDIQLSRRKYGRNEFTIESTYIQDDNTANNIMGWVIDKTLRPRKMVGVTTFGTQTYQLGDIVTINYKTNKGTQVVSDAETRYVIYNIDYNRKNDSIETTLSLAEV